MRFDAIHARAAFSFDLVTYVVSIENLGHQTNLPDGC
jgi:hypothetical protein